VLLTKESYAIDHLLRPGARSLEPSVEPGILALEVLNALGRDHALAPRCLESLETRLCLEGATTKGGELITEVLHELLELGEGCCFRTYAV
jgi:hypothetical protein